MSATFQTAEELRGELQRRGVALQIRGENLLCIPKGAAAELLPEVARFKPSLLETLHREQRDAGELARIILDCRRPNGPGFDYGKLRPFWRAANELTGIEMDSPQLATWARANVTQ